MQAPPRVQRPCHGGNGRAKYWINRNSRYCRLDAPGRGPRRKRLLFSSLTVVRPLSTDGKLWLPALTSLSSVIYCDHSFEPMNRRKQIITLIIVFFILAALVYLQVREWRKFDWATLRQYATELNWWMVLQGVILVHLADFMRAIRWKIFLRPTRPDVNWKSLIASQYVGFAGLALLGRPGELVRPYLIALKTNES